MTEETVAVPVTLLRAILTDYEPQNWVWQQVSPLIPSPNSRLVAVKYDPTVVSSVRYDELDEQPDLLTLIDREIEEVCWRLYGLDPAVATALKARIRAALGVSA